MNELLKDKEHLVRLAGLFVAGLLVFLVLQRLLIPAGFGAYGHYRAGAIEDNRARPPKHAGQATCMECHTDEADARKAGQHAKVACEACHGPLATHAAAPETMKPTRPDPRKLCLVCHQANVAKPAGFKQIEPKDHPDAVCTECHTAHNPGVAPEAKK